MLQVIAGGWMAVMLFSRAQSCSVATRCASRPFWPAFLRLFSAFKKKVVKFQIGHGP